MVELGGKKSDSSGVNYIDITFVLLLAMSWFFLVQVASSPVIIAMTSVSWFIVSIMIVSRFTGFLSFMKITKPTWTISYLISIPIWWALFSILPQTPVASAISESAESVITQFMPSYVFNWFVNSDMFAITESLIIVFLASFFIGIAIRKGRTQRDGNKRGQLWALLMISGFAALLHTGVAMIKASAVDASFSMSVILVHQVIAFFIMLILAMFFGAPALLSSHMSKNDIIYAVNGLWLFNLGLCILMDLISIFTNKGKNKNPLATKHNRSFT